MQRRHLVESVVAKKKGKIIGESVLITKTGEVIFVEDNAEYMYEKGDSLVVLNREIMVPKYVYYALVNLKNTKPEDFATIYK